MSMVLALAMLHPSVGAIAQTPARAVPTLREQLAAYNVSLTAGVPGDLERRLVNYAVQDAPDLFVIAYHAAQQFDDRRADTLYVSAFDRGTRQWVHAGLEPRRESVPVWDIGTVLRIHHSDRHVLLDTHRNPSAGMIIVLSRQLTPVAALDGWVLRVLTAGVVLYHRSSVHFAPTHSAELWTWDGATGRDLRLYPGVPPDSVRRAYIDTVEAIYRRTGEAWFRANNHHMGPVRFDSRLLDSVTVGPTGRDMTFVVRFGGGDGTPAATPTLDVVVRCRDVGLRSARCSDAPLSARR